MQFKIYTSSKIIQSVFLFQNLASGNANTAVGSGAPTGHMILQTGGQDNKLVAVANMPKEQL